LSCAEDDQCLIWDLLKELAQGQGGDMKDAASLLAKHKALILNSEELFIERSDQLYKDLVPVSKDEFFEYVTCQSFDKFAPPFYYISSRRTS
jgi:hypothetical protein